MWYRFEKNNPIGIPRVEQIHVAFYDMERDGGCFDEAFYPLSEIDKVMPYVETVEDEGKSDRTRVFLYFDNGDEYELKLEKIDKGRKCGYFYDEDNDVECDYEEGYDPNEDDNVKFIWGVKSWDDLTGADACLYTMNDIDITYDKSRKVYMLGVETAYLFKTYGDECQYLRDCLNAFTKYMDDNGLNKNEPYRLWMSNPCTNMEAETIEELYTNFKIFVDGFCNLDIDVVRKCEDCKYYSGIGVAENAGWCEKKNAATAHCDWCSNDFKNKS